MPNEEQNQSGQGDTGAGDAGKTESLLGGAAGGGAADQGGKPEGESLIGGADKGKSDEKKGDAKADEKKPAVPEKYEFKAPEGVQLDAALIEKATPLFKDLGLSQEAAQKLVDFQAAQQAEASKAFAERLGKWQAEVKALPESAKLLGDAKLALTKLADPETQVLFGSSWMGSHPGIIKMLAAAGKILREDPLHEGRAGKHDGPGDIADAMFGDRFAK